MARDRNDAVKVYRSGSLYLVASGDRGTLIDRKPTGETDLQSIFAHCNTQDPWEEVPDRAQFPPAVAAIVADRETKD